MLGFQFLQNLSKVLPAFFEQWGPPLFAEQDLQAKSWRLGPHETRKIVHHSGSLRSSTKFYKMSNKNTTTTRKIPIIITIDNSSSISMPVETTTNWYISIHPVNCESFENRFYWALSFLFTSQIPNAVGNEKLPLCW